MLRGDTSAYESRFVADSQWDRKSPVLGGAILHDVGNPAASGRVNRPAAVAASGEGRGKSQGHIRANGAGPGETGAWPATDY